MYSTHSSSSMFILENEYELLESDLVAIVTRMVNGVLVFSMLKTHDGSYRRHNVDLGFTCTKTVFWC
ncbi:hypothetical protein HanIR_Chr16g0789511 [Helianthus annuus]|nr:hypothetical protein HanIR_Chr16g0789511 [Helianthus annuus]